MSRLRRILLLPAMLGLAFGLMSFGLGPGSASAQAYLTGSGNASVSCPGWPTGSCTITLDSYVGAGGSFQVMLPDNTTVVTVNCTAGPCVPGETFTVTVSPTVLSSGFNSYVTPGGCGNSYWQPGFGCASAQVYFAPSVYYTQPTYVAYPDYTTYQQYIPYQQYMPVTYPSYGSTWNNGYGSTWNNGYGSAWNNGGNSWCHRNDGDHDRDDRRFRDPDDNGTMVWNGSGTC